MKLLTGLLAVRISKQPDPGSGYLADCTAAVGGSPPLSVAVPAEALVTPELFVQAAASAGVELELPSQHTANDYPILRWQEMLAAVTHAAPDQEPLLQVRHTLVGGVSFGTILPRADFPGGGLELDRLRALGAVVNL